jgi:hypothetical protein
LQKGSKGVHFEVQRGSKGVQNGTTYIEEQRTIELEQINQEQHADGALNLEVQASLAVWLSAKEDLRSKLAANAWSLWVRPAMLLNVFAGRFLLVALPPNGRILEAARANKQLVQDVLTKRDYALAGFTIYPDAWTRDQVAIRYPRVAKTMLGRAR